MAAPIIDCRGVSVRFGGVHALRGDRDKAIEVLGHALSAGFAKAEYLETDPDLASVRSDERFAQLMTAAEINAGAKNLAQAGGPCECSAH